MVRLIEVKLADPMNVEEFKELKRVCKLIYDKRNIVRSDNLLDSMVAELQSKLQYNVQMRMEQLAEQVLKSSGRLIKGRAYRSKVPDVPVVLKTEVEGYTVKVNANVVVEFYVLEDGSGVMVSGISLENIRVRGGGKNE